MSFAGTADITFWGYYRYHGYPGQPGQVLEHSPLMYVENVTTPTILITGEDDLRTPMAQTEEYYQALKQLGVPTKMLRFHAEAHGRLEAVELHANPALPDEVVRGVRRTAQDDERGIGGPARSCACASERQQLRDLQSQGPVGQGGPPGSGLLSRRSE